MMFFDTLGESSETKTTSNLTKPEGPQSQS